MVHPTTWKCSQLGKEQPSFGHGLPGRNSGSFVLAAETAAWWYCLDFMAVLWKCVIQGCFGMGVCSSAESLVWWSEGWLWTVPISGQAFLEEYPCSVFGWLLQTTGFTADLHVTFARPVWVPCVLPWSKQETEMGRSWAKLASLAWLEFNKPGHVFLIFFFSFVFIHLNGTPVTWTLEEADPGEDLRSGLPLLRFQTATSGDWRVCASQLSGNMRRAWQDGIGVPYWNGNWCTYSIYICLWSKKMSNCSKRGWKPLTLEGRMSFC